MSRSTQPLFDSLEARRLMAADLTVSAIDVATPLRIQGQDTEAVIRITNNGDLATKPGVTVKLAFSRDAVWGNADDILLGTRTIGQTIRPGETAELIYTGRAAGQPQGVFRLGAYVDSRNTVAEKRQTNNFGLSAADAVTYYFPMEDDTQWGREGTTGDDVVTFRARNDMAVVSVNNRVYGTPLDGLTKMTFDAGPGNDVIDATNFPIDLGITGSGGDDVIIGGLGHDELGGANGRDRVFGGKGNDLIFGGGSNDRLYGEEGNDILNGNRGHDMLFAGAGTNELHGGDHNDRLISVGNHAVDSLYGGPGKDVKDADLTDLVDGIEA